MMTPERTAYLRQIATNTMAHGKTWTGPLGEVLMQAADAIRELATEADELAALRAEHEAWGAIIDVTRKDRDAARAQVAELTAGIDAVIDRKRIVGDKPEILHTLQRHYEMVCETAGKTNDTIEDIGKVLKIDALDSDDVVADVCARVAELERAAAGVKS